MDLQSRKIEFIQEFLKLESDDAISKLELTLKNISNKLKSEPVEPMTMEELNARIDKSEDDFVNGSYISAEELLEKFK
ncbi:hypothetical protein LX97_01364 [Nonlabens dokdonensis]|jgi:hypothetical protein|uniref:Uncharacterized protein n=2 Tax=Nonlabens dokdonensis TaxID=328515 RepID=L7WA37_NONDD|nr:hypothetical protein [Nonlabens dokdonensis]AGC76706.1 hypothetical protein DDD_1579 [Nonlabens dokdonensis DSW-6]PZX44353.1 hypothetical protein LX97_01364 [Nonlabens dokdonensis]